MAEKLDFGFRAQPASKKRYFLTNLYHNALIRLVWVSGLCNW